MKGLLAGSLTAVAALADPPSVLACSPPCAGLLPYGTDASPAHLPANGVFVVPPYTVATPLDVVRTRDGVSEAVTYPLQPGGTWLTDVHAGDRLVVSAMSTCAGGASISSVIVVTPEAPIPTELGVLEVEASRPTPVAVWDNRGACTSDLVSTAAPFTVTLDARVEPWSDALVETLLVDDEPWWGTSDPRVAERFVFTACEPRLESQVGGPDLPVGAHRLRVRGSLRGFDATFDTNEETFELDCASEAAGCVVAWGRRRLGTTGLALAVVGLMLARRRKSRASTIRARNT